MTLLVDKYQPKNLSEIEGQKKAVGEALEWFTNWKFQENKAILFAGPPGIGKSTLAHAFAKEYKLDILELNASDDRGIKAVNDIIPNFCKKTMDMNPRDKPLYAAHKIVILDEADNMTIKAQQLISKLMEKYYNTVRFAFTCNEKSDIIESIFGSSIESVGAMVSI